MVGRLSHPEAIRRLVRSGTNAFGEGAAILMRRDAALAAGGFDARRPYVIDLDMWVRLLRSGPAIGLAETLATFRVSKDQWSVALARQQARHVRQLFAELRADPACGIRRRDALVGWIRAGLIARMRRIIYLWIRRRRSR